MKFGHRIHGTVEAYDDKGRGTFELSGDKPEGYQLGKGRVAVPFTSVGDEIEATFIKRDGGIKIAKLETVKTPSPDRIPAPCPHAGVCGGCLWQHMKYEAQVRLKHEMINRALEKAGHEERISNVMPSDDQFYYRNRMDYVVGWLGEIGLKEYGSWSRYLNLSTCLLLNKDTPQILQIVRDLMKEFELEPWDAKFHTGLVRYVVIREGKNSHECMIMLVVSDATRIEGNVRAAMLERLGPLCTSLLIGQQALITDLSYVQSSIALKGETHFHEDVNGLRYKIAPNSFFQTNSKMAAKLQDAVLELCHSDLSSRAESDRVEGSASSVRPIQTDPSTALGMTGPHLLDLYCGLGFFGIAAAKKYPSLKVHGFELDAEAINLASQNAEANGVAAQCNFASGPAEDLSWKDIPADTIILDPPRSGLHPRVIKTVMEKAPDTIVYVSCNFHRLVDELKEFKKLYRVESMSALDLFPNTPHVEVVTKLVRI